MNRHADFSNPLEINQQPSSNNQETVKYLSKKSITLSNQELQLDDLMVPPTTPNDLIPDFEVTKVPQFFPKLSTVNLPLVREIGVKESIKVLAEIYNCKKYKHNLVQFWFLDFITDCLWKVQDEFQFPEEHQKIILEWVSYAFNLIRAPHLNLPRKQIFKIFNEALSIAELFIETGCEYLPLPGDLFTLSETVKPPEKPSGSSSSSLDDPKMAPELGRNNSYLAIELDDGVRFFDLPQKVFPWDTDDECLSSTVETVSENEIVIVKPENSDIQIAEDVSPDFDQANALMFEDFYKPDLSTPSRFAHSEDSSFSDSVSFSYESESIDLEEDDDEGNAGPPTWVMSKKKAPDVPCPSKLFEMKPEEKKRSEKKKEEEAIKSWYDYHLWQIRKKSMNDSSIGYLSSEEKIDQKKSPDAQKTNQTESDANASYALANLTEYMKMIHDYMKELREHRFVNTCVIMAIREIVYDYFYDSFQFSAIKMVYRYPHLLYTQGLNKEWHTPKKTKTELKRPKPKKKKVEKPKKEKPPKVESALPPKKEKKSSKKDSLEPEVMPKGEKTEKDHEEEKLELERINEEKEKLKELERIAEENRMLVFPLTDAVDETFFLNIFPSKQKKKGK